MVSMLINKVSYLFTVISLNRLGSYFFYQLCIQNQNTFRMTQFTFSNILDLNFFINTELETAYRVFYIIKQNNIVYITGHSLDVCVLILFYRLC